MEPKFFDKVVPCSIRLLIEDELMMPFNEAVCEPHQDFVKRLRDTSAVVEVILAKTCEMVAQLFSIFFVGPTSTPGCAS